MTEKTVQYCEECGSSQLRIRGTNIRAANAGDSMHFKCRDCGHRMKNPPKRPSKNPLPDRPNTGLARALWDRDDD